MLDNALDWLFEVARDPEDDSWDEFIARVGVLVMGATTYEWVLGHEHLLEEPDKWHAFHGDRPCWVFTHREPVIPGADLHFARGDVEAAYDEIASAAGDRDVWVVGGGDLVDQFDDAGHLDEIQLGMCPVFLGAGAPVLPRRITSRRLHLREVHRSGQQTRMVLDVRRDAQA